ncbi:MAG: endonuclease/exonuclease/phosphatase family protein [Acidobacteria bacterium]|nr:endonuclease/exonuclease/phosphatase family protein [Acidobacteriota bacterium]
MHKIRSRFLAVLLLLLSVPAWGQQPVRVATYNIRFFDTNVTQQGDRLQKLQEVIQLLDADVIGLQEIDDRAALELLFAPSQWTIVIDNDSANNQDVTVVVRQPFTVIGVDSDLDAEDRNFLFPGAQNNTNFPNRRDLLAIEIQVPGQSSTFFVMVHHAKARSGGRASTDSRREGASRDILRVLEQDFDDRDYILLGDFNDNPDDRSLNILEMGNPDAPGGPEEIQGPFLINLLEPLVVLDHVSHGRKSSDIVTSQPNRIKHDRSRKSPAQQRRSRHRRSHRGHPIRPDLDSCPDAYQVQPRLSTGIRSRCCDSWKRGE